MNYGVGRIGQAHKAGNQLAEQRLSWMSSKAECVRVSVTETVFLAFPLRKFLSEQIVRSKRTPLSLTAVKRPFALELPLHVNAYFCVLIWDKG